MWIKKKLDFYLILYSKVHLSWIIDLGVKAKIMKLLEENVGEYLHHLSVGKNFLEHKIDKLKDYRKLRISMYQDIIHIEKSQAIYCRKILTLNKSGEGLVSRKYK